MSKYYKRDRYGFYPVNPVQPVWYGNGVCHFLSFIANVIILFTIKNKITDYLALFNDLYIIIAAHPFGMRCS
jgi:hypothetical protein